MRGLAQYMGQSCFVSGFLELWQKMGSSTGVLLTKCSCEGLDGWSHSEDHLWVYLPTPMFERCISRFRWTRLDKVSFAGTVESYTRGDGSIDIGVDQDPSLIRWSVFRDETMPKLARSGSWATIIKEIDGGKIYNDFCDLDRADFLADLAQKRAWAATQRAPKESRPLAPMSLSIPSVKRIKSKGFDNK